MGIKRDIIYLVDTENKHTAYINELAKVGENDEVIVFQTGNDPKISMSMITKVMECKGRVLFEKGFVGTANALDMQVASLLGFLISCEASKHYVIVSSDSGFLRLADYWQNHNVSVHVCTEIGAESEKVYTTLGIRFETIDWLTRDESESLAILRERKTNGSLGLLFKIEDEVNAEDCTEAEEDIEHEELQEYNEVYSAPTYTRNRPTEITSETDSVAKGVDSNAVQTKLFRKFPELEDKEETYKDIYAELLKAGTIQQARTALDKLDELTFVYHNEAKEHNFELIKKYPDMCFSRVAINTIATILLCTTEVEDFRQALTLLLKLGVIKNVQRMNPVDAVLYADGLCKWLKGAQRFACYKRSDLERGVQSEGLNKLC